MSQFTFEDLSVYDSPEVLASLVLDDEFTVRGAWQAIVNPDKLSPKERDTYASRLQQQYGTNPVMRAVTGIVTNPMTWVLFLTSPPGLRSAFQGGATLMRQAPKFSAGIRKYAPFMSPFLNATQRFRNSAIPAAAAQIAEEKALVQQRYYQYLKDHADIFKKHGLDAARGFNPDLYASPTAKAIAREMGDAATAYRYKWGEEIEEPFFRIKRGKVHISTVKRGALGDKAKVEEALAKYPGLREYVDAQARFERDMMLELTGDKDRLLRLFRSIQRPANGQSALTDASGFDLLRQVSVNMPEAIAAGKMSQDQFDQVMDAFSQVVRDNPNYVPRNLSAVWVQDAKRGMRPLAPWELGDEVKWNQPARRGVGRATPRQTSPKGVAYDLEDLRRLGGKFGTTQAYNELAGVSRARLRRLKGGSTENPYVRLVRMDADAAHRRYEKQFLNAWTNSLKPNDSVLYAQELRAAEFEEAVKQGLSNTGANKPFHQPGARHFLEAAQRTSRAQQVAQGLGSKKKPRYGPKGYSLTGSMRKAAADEVPLGGWSINDVLYAEAAFQKGTDAKVLNTSVIPMLLGQSPPLSSAMVATALKMKDGAREAADLLDKIGAPKAMTSSMRGWADIDPRLGNPGGMGDGLSRYLYSSMLGLNMGSVINQVLQPMVFLAPMYGTGPTIRGYSSALNDLTQYAKWRASLGKARISEAQRLEGVRKTMPLLADDDFVNLTRPMTDAIEEAMTGAGRSFVDPPSWRDTLLFEWPLWAFQKGEWLNRLASAYTVAHVHRVRLADAAKAAGVAVPSGTSWKEVLAVPGVKDTIRTVVNETQFVSGPLNTPNFIQSLPFLRDYSPLRQFLSFPTRSAVMATQMGYLGGGQGRYLLGGTKVPFSENPLVAGAFDLTRMMGISAVVYEGWKGLAGADLSRGLAYSAVTDALPFFEGGRFSDKDSLVPVPPIVDLGAGVFRGMLEQDKNLLLAELPKLVPGGIALQRALGSAPESAFVPDAIQKTYVGWDRPLADGRVPVFKNDGTLLEYQDPKALWLRGVGIDAGATRTNTRLSRYVKGVTEESRAYKSEYLKKLMAGDSTGAEGVAYEFEKRFGAPLKISQAQMSAAMKSRTVPVAERMADRAPEEVRPQVNSLLASQSQLFNTRSQSLTESPTSGARPREGSFTGFTPYQSY